MKKLIIIMLFTTVCCKAQYSLKDEIFGKSNIMHIGKKGYIEKDKFLHGTAGAFIGSSVYMYIHYKTDSKFLSATASLFAAFSAGWVKEVYDRKNGREFSNDDIIFTVSGGWSGVFTKIIQIDIQTNNKLLAEEYKSQFQNLSK